MYRNVKRNNPIATVIKNYIDKKSGKVSESRNEIRKRFSGLDWEDQKRIMDAFLDSGKSDREWVYSRLLDLWDPSFEQKVKELWERYHENRCAWIIIRHFPLDFIKSNLGQFDADRNYYFICLRLAKDKDYVIEKNKLSHIDYMAVLYHTEREFTDDEARDTLFGVVHDCCVKDAYLTRLGFGYSGKRGNVITPAIFRDVDLGIYYLTGLGRAEVVRQFKVWDKEVGVAIRNSQELRAVNTSVNLIDGEALLVGVKLANIYAYSFLDEKYKLPSDPSVEDLRKTFEESLEWFSI